jgi:hypothetical protein
VSVKSASIHGRWGHAHVFVGVGPCDLTGFDHIFFFFVWVQAFAAVLAFLLQFYAFISHAMQPEIIRKSR